MDAKKRKGPARRLKAAGLVLLVMTGLAAAFVVWYGAYLTEPQINGYKGLYYAAKLTLTGKTVMRYSDDPPRFFAFGRGQDSTQEWSALGVEWKEHVGAISTATLHGALYNVHRSSFTGWGGLAVFIRMSPEEVKTVVFKEVRSLCYTRFGCDGDVELSSTFDELNILPHEREELALSLEEIYGVAVPDEELESFSTLEDMVGYIEDRL